MRALIGHTGFVGSNLARTGKYDAFFNSRNSGDIRGCSFSEIVCAGTSAVKWKANRDPEADINAIDSLVQNLRQVKRGGLYFYLQSMFISLLLTSLKTIRRLLAAKPMEFIAHNSKGLSVIILMTS